MPRTRPPYPKAFREQIVALARNGGSAAELAQEFEPSEQTIRNWIKRAEIDSGARSDGPTSAEREELRRLRKELRRLKQERDILAMRRNPCGAAWFARETDAAAPKSSNS